MKPYLKLINCDKIRQQLKEKIAWELDYLVSNLTKYVGPWDAERTVFIDANYPELGNISITNLEGEVFIKMYDSWTQTTEKSTLFQLDIYKDFKNKEGYLKIVPVSIYNVAPFVRQGQPIAPAGSRFKIDFKIPQGKKSKIPKKLQGIQFYETKEDAENALKDKKNFTTNFFKNEEFKKKLTIWKN